MSNGALTITMFFLGFSIAAFVLAEFGLTSLIGGWTPTHETAIASGIISIAFSTFANAIK